MNRKERSDLLVSLLKKRVLVLDGAMGTAIQNRNLTEADFGGADFYGCNEYLVLTKPKVIEEIHAEYLEAGADIIETNTFGSTAMVLDEFDLGAKANAINLEAAKLARQVADRLSTPEKPRFVAGSIGPTTKAITVTGGITFEALIQEFYGQAKALYEGGVDYFLLETCQDTRNVKAAILALNQVLSEVSEPIPIAISCTIEPMGTMLAGQTVDAFATSLDHVSLLYLGLNCATGPEFMTDHIRTLSGMFPSAVACVPNAGLPDEEGNYLETPEMMVKVLNDFGKQGWLNLIGGCCGTTPAHIQAFAELAEKLKPRAPVKRECSTLSGIEYLEITDDNRPVIVGERTNVIGSRKFKRLICEGSIEEASEIARAQVKRGAHIIDVCMANPDRDELEDMDAFMQVVINKVKVPFMIDSTDEVVIERALTFCQGKAIINSINLEDGEERFEKVVPLAKKYGAALVVGCIDEDPNQGMAVTQARKLSIAERSHDLLTQKYGVAPQDICFDPLVFPCATGDEQYIGSAPETIEGVRLIKERFPLCKTVLGISNVSFGLPNAGREVLNAVFLYHCTKAGLDLAIVNSEKLERYASIPDEEKKLAEDLLWNRNEQCVMAFADYFRQVKKEKKSTGKKLPLEKRLANYIIEGSKDGLVPDLDLALKKNRPLEIINGPLMSGMQTVGKLFNDNELIVAEVLQSAEAMKAAVTHLEQFMEKSAGQVQDKVILATVKGDVHDIGKNLVEIILNNNGYEVVNLGIKIAPEQLIAAIREHQPQVVGLSGLLVKSAQQMVITAEDLSKAKIDVPVLVGGAALSQRFVDKKIAPAYDGFVEYAKDAMMGLDLTRKLLDEGDFQDLKEEAQSRRAHEESTQTSSASSSGLRISTKVIQPMSKLPKVPDFEPHILTQVPLDQLWPFMNPLMLYGKHLGMKGKVVKQMNNGFRKRAANEPELSKALEVYEAIEDLKTYCRQGHMQAKAVYRFYAAARDGDAICLYENHQSKTPVARFQFPRQESQGQKGLCLADYLAPLTQGVAKDSVCVFVVSAGEGIREISQTFKEEGAYLKSHGIQALAIETAEAFAEYLHAKIRGLWGFPDPTGMTMMARFQSRYRGCRYSPGYPACPDLSDQRTLFNLLKPEEIGINLTEGFMMEPEASVSAMVFHHEQAEYFSVGVNA